MSTSTATTTTQSMPGIGSQFISSASTGSSGTPASSLNANSFLTLFLAQLQNQDPTSPM